MDNDHSHHNHHSTRGQANKRVEGVEERLEEKTLHGHSHAMHKDTSGHPPHGEHGHEYGR